MKTVPTLLSFLLLVAVSAIPQNGIPQRKGVIYGVVVDENNQPAKGIGITAAGPRGTAMSSRLPAAITDQNGHYRFVNLFWGTYNVYVEDWDAGYLVFTNSEFHEVSISSAQPEVEFNFRLPSKAGFLDFHLTNRKTGEEIGGIEVTIMLPSDPQRVVNSVSQPGNRPVLVAPDRDLLIHVTANGFKEWVRSAGQGLPIRVKSGNHLRLDVQLEPAG